jgi:hypothetical protein
MHPFGRSVSGLVDAFHAETATKLDVVYFQLTVPRNETHLVFRADVEALLPAIQSHGGCKLLRRKLAGLRH